MNNFNSHEMVSVKTSQVFHWLDDNGMSVGFYATLPSINVLSSMACGYAFNSNCVHSDKEHIQQIAISEIKGGKLVPLLRIGTNCKYTNGVYLGYVFVFAMNLNGNLQTWEDGKYPDDLKFDEAEFILKLLNCIISKKTWYKFDETGNRLPGCIEAKEAKSEFVANGEGSSDTDQMAIKLYNFANELIDSVRDEPYDEAPEAMGNVRVLLPKVKSPESPCLLVAFRYYRYPGEGEGANIYVSNLDEDHKAVNGFRLFYYRAEDEEEGVCQVGITGVGETEFHGTLGIPVDELSEDQVRSIHDDILTVESIEEWEGLHANEMEFDFPDEEE